MQEFIEAVKAWPVIIQGALGSALFWLILKWGESITIKIAEKLSHHSKNSRFNWLIDENCKYNAVIAQDTTEMGAYAALLIYRSLRHFYKAVMWLIIGLLFESVLSPAGTIGFIGSIYYLLKAYEPVKGISGSEEEIKIKLEEINKEIDDYKKDKKDLA